VRQGQEQRRHLEQNEVRQERRPRQAAGVFAGYDPDEDGRRHHLDPERQNKNP
jgi:hypothetical protein